MVSKQEDQTTCATLSMRMWVSRIRFLNSNSCSFPLWWPCTFYTSRHLHFSLDISLHSPIGYLHEGWLFRSSHCTENYLTGEAQHGVFFSTLDTITKLGPLCLSVSQSLAGIYILMGSFREQSGLSLKGIKLVWGFVQSRGQVQASQESLQCKFSCYIWVLTRCPKIFILDSQHAHTHKYTQIRAYHPEDATSCPLGDMWDSWGK